jgi:hypothetical protein
MRRLSFRAAAWIAPLAYGAHIAEETAGDFPAWMRAHVVATFSRTAFVQVNLVAMSVLVLLTALASTTRARGAVGAYLAWASALLFWNALVHLGATALFGAYSPGSFTAALVYLPAFSLLVRAVHREGLLPPSAILAAMAGGAALHAGLGLALARGVFSA